MIKSERKGGLSFSISVNGEQGSTTQAKGSTVIWCS